MRLVSTILAALLLAVRPAAQEPAAPPQVVFRAGTELVQLDVTVLDGRRQPVTGLTAVDFVVLEDGQPREVETFAAVDLADRVVATEAAWMAEVPPDVADNQIATEEGRLVVILMDRSIAPGYATVLAREVATAAVTELGPADMAALVSTSGGVPQNFTTDRARLIRAINQRDWSTGVSAEAREISAKLAEGDEGESLPDLERIDGRCLCGLCVHETVTTVARALEDLPRRRKSILFIGSRFRLQAGPDELPQLVRDVAQPEEQIGCGARLEEANRVLFASLDRSGVTVHSIDPSGLQTVGPTSQAASTLRGISVRGAQVGAINTQLQEQGELRVLPDRTGGRTVVNTNGPQERVPEIFRESQSYYLLGFRPGEAAKPGRPRSINVKVNRRGVNVYTRREVVLPDPAAPVSSTAASALNGLLPNANLPMDVNVAAFAVPDSPRAAVTVSVGVQAFAPATGAAPTEEPLEVVVAAYDQAGRPQAFARQTLDLEWPAAAADGAQGLLFPPRLWRSAEASREGGQARRPARVDVLSRLDLEPGDYEIRVAAAAAGGARAASVFTHLTVPSFFAARLSLSNIVIDATATTSSVPSDFLDAVLPVRPTPQRTFPRGSAAAAFVRVYQGAARDDELEPVQVRVRIVDSQDRDVRDELLVLSEAAFAVDRTAGLRMPLPLATLPAGDYLLRLEAATGAHLAGRAVRFTIE